MTVLKFICHSKNTLVLALKFGWLTGARYTHLRDIRSFANLGFLDIDWKNYDFDKHYLAAKQLRPMFTVARDIEDIKDFDTIIEQAYALSKFAKKIIIVPKDLRLKNMINEIPKEFLIGYSVPTQYGGTAIPLKYFTRPVHLLGGRPDIQRNLANKMLVHSIDCNRFTIDAKYGKYFDGIKFQKHSKGGYLNCLAESLQNINMIWENYHGQ